MQATDSQASTALTADADTLLPATTNVGRTAATLPCLTLVYHADLRRVGERFVIEPNTRTTLSRLGPDFGRPDHSTRGPLADRYISRAGVVCHYDPARGVRLTPSKAGLLRIDDVATDTERWISHDEIHRGCAITLSRRAVLLLHTVAAHLPAPSYDLVGHSDAIETVRRSVRRVAGLTVPVLLRGETGTGKEKVARAIHAASARAEAPFVAVNMAAVTPATAVSELFGHEQGAFTGATTRHVGLFERAHGGTLFLDEIGEVPSSVQPMLLRVLDEGRFLPVGASRERAVDVRVIAATDADLATATDEGTFRHALLYRLSGFEIRLPPLRDRRDDIARLAVHFICETLTELGDLGRLDHSNTAKPWLPRDVMVALLSGEWRGNVRQLRNAIRQLLIANRNADRLAADSVFRELVDEAAAPPSGAEDNSSSTSPQQLADVLRAHGWAPGPTAKALNVAKSTLYGMLSRAGIPVAKDLDAADIRRSFAANGGDSVATANALQVSARGLRLRLKQLGLVAEEVES